MYMCHSKVMIFRKLTNLILQGEEFHKKAHEVLGWLAGAERQLRYRGPIPDEEPALLKQIEDHKVCTPSPILVLSKLTS